MIDDNGKEEILEAIHAFSSAMDVRMGGLEGRIGGLEGRMDSLAQRMDRMESQMATKDFVDRRIGELEARIAPVARQIDAKDTALVEKLGENDVIAKSDVKNIVELSPFPTT